MIKTQTVTVLVPQTPAEIDYLFERGRLNIETLTAMGRELASRVRREEYEAVHGMMDLIGYAADLFVRSDRLSGRTARDAESQAERVLGYLLLGDIDDAADEIGSLRDMIYDAQDRENDIQRQREERRLEGVEN